MEPVKRKPNIILILTDDQGYGDMACHGNPWLQTPEMDRLHADAARLTSFHVDPMCAPTRAALMTGRYAARTGVWSTLKGRYIMHRDEVTMAEIFADSGYATGIFGKWHLGDSWPYRPFDRGFQESLSFGGGVVGEIPDYWDNDYFNAVYERNGKPQPFENRYCTDVWFDETIDFIERHREEPFFCYLSTNAPHNPFNVDTKYSDPYLEMGVPDERARFYGMITCIDENLGRLRRTLDDLNLARDTILIYMGDNGTSGGVDVDPGSGFRTGGYNAGMRGKKCWAYEGGHRNACLIHWPGGDLTQGKDIDALTSHIDVLPTLARLCDLNLPEPAPDFDGRDLTALLSGARQDHPDDRTLCVHNQQRDIPQKYKDFEVITRRWQLVKTTEWGSGELELFDAQGDGEQAENLAEEHPDIVRGLMAEYERWWDHVSERFAGNSAIFVGGEQNPVPITCHAWHGEQGLYNQWHVRPALVDNGYWPIEVVREGEYEVKLHRWPRETQAAICAPLPERRNVPFVDDFVPGVALDIRRARLSIGDHDETVPVAPSDVCSPFRVRLHAGPCRLQTWFIDEQGVERGAYYVYVRHLDA